MAGNSSRSGRGNQRGNQAGRGGGHSVPKLESSSPGPAPAPASSSAAAAAVLLDFALPALKSLVPALASDPDSLGQIVSHASGLDSDVAMSRYLTDLVGDVEPAAVVFVSDFVSRAMRAKKASQSSSSLSSQSSAMSASRGMQAQAQAQGRDRVSMGNPTTKLSNNNSSSSSNNNAGQGTLVADLLDRRPKNKREKQTAKAKDEQQSSRGGWGPVKMNPEQARSKTGHGARVQGRGGSSTTATTFKISGTAPKPDAPPTALNELDAAIKALEEMKVSSESGGRSRTDDSNNNDDNNNRPVFPDRQCGCQARKHPLLTVAPNCMGCGKIVCVAEGLGPCTFCGKPLVRPDEVSDMIAALRQDRGAERMRVHNDRAGKGSSSTPGTGTGTGMGTPVKTYGAPDAVDALASAKSLRDRLLGYQADNVNRNRIHDTSGDLDLSLARSGGGGGSGLMWASPAERARSLQAQAVLMTQLRDRVRREIRPGMVINEYDDDDDDDDDDGTAYGRMKTMTLSVGADGKVGVEMVRNIDAARSGRDFDGDYGGGEGGDDDFEKGDTTGDDGDSAVGMRKNPLANIVLRPTFGDEPDPAAGKKLRRPVMAVVRDYDSEPDDDGDGGAPVAE